MTDTAITNAPAELVACAHCGHRDSGTYCSACGKELVDDPNRTVAHEVWEMLVVDRLNDAREFAMTIWHLLVRPVTLFRMVLARAAARASHVFPEPAPEAIPEPGRGALRPGSVQGPVTFYVLSFVTAILVGKITGAEVSGQLISGLDDDFNNELTLLFILLALGVYGLVFRRASGRRISTEEAAIVSGYTMGAATALTAVLGVIPGGETAAGFAALYLIVGVPLMVLPRLYGMSRRRVFGAQLAAGFAALVALGLMVLAVQSATGADVT
jgi:hypothetical protein